MNGLVLALDAGNTKNYNLTEVEYLIVAGGGSGGSYVGGGGGGGGVLQGSFVVGQQSYTITVGAGGASAGSISVAQNIQGNNGGNSSAFGFTAVGGGGGGRYAHIAGSSGGSGGGSGGFQDGSSSGGAGTSGQGNAGGGTIGPRPRGFTGGGGGGGAGTAGQTSTNALNTGGNGGDGIISYILGVPYYFGGGGGGGNYADGSRPGNGGLGGGGGGSSNSANVSGVGGGSAINNTSGGNGSPTGDPNNLGGNGAANSGGGGGGNGHYGLSGAGGSGIVIVRYPGPQKAIGGTVTSVGGYTIHTFTTVGSTTFTPLVATNNSAILGLADFSGRNNFATASGPTYSSGNGGSLSFDGVDDEVQLPGTNFSLNTMTISAWNYSSNYAQNGFMFEKTTNGTVNTQYSLFFNGDNTIYYRTKAVSTEDLTVNTTTAGVVNNQWNNVVATFDGTNKRIYVNGILRATSANLTGTVTQNTSGIALIGRHGNPSSYPFNGRIAQTQIYNRALSAAEIQQNYNALKGRYTLDGSTSDRAAPSASYLVSLGITADGIYWINLPTAGPTQIYCILNPAYDGGGWMMAMKATRGTTFNYSANYWTTANTLNPTQTNRNDGDAKFNSMNYFQAKDMMAVWPDISNGGSIPGSTLGWTWLENNFNDGTRITPISFFGITYPTMNAGGSGKFIKDAKTFSGWASGVFSSQVDIRFYGFNYTNNPSYGLSMKCRWGFGWNENGEGLYPSSGGGAPGSNDVAGGIGLDTGGGSYSAGDVIVCCQDTIGINRSARVEVYVR
jgi:hypothetical protein